MKKLRSIEEIKRKHAELYEQILKDRSFLSKKSGHQYRSLLTAADGLVEDIVASLAVTTLIDDYRWLTVAAMKWQEIYSSILDVRNRKAIDIPPPQKRLLVPPPPSHGVLLEEEIIERIKKYAYFNAFFRIRETRWDSTQEERKEDLQHAEVWMASDVLDGVINFTSCIASSSYWHLEYVWVKDVKRLRAYFIWQKRGGGVDPIRQMQDYYEVCEHLQAMLVNPGIKAQAAEFVEVKAYIENRYLSGGKVDKDKPSAKALIDRKAFRISERMREMNRETDPEKNWIDAETYVCMFYENIIPAVIEGDSERVLTVLKAFQYSKSIENRYYVINCFEVALATYFLNPETIEALWQQSEGEAWRDSALENSVAVSSWPKGFEVPQECRGSFWQIDDKIFFRGVMAESQRQALVAEVREKGEDERCIEAIEALFKKSRLIHRETSL